MSKVGGYCNIKNTNKLGLQKVFDTPIFAP